MGGYSVLYRDILGMYIHTYIEFKVSQKYDITPSLRTRGS